MTQSALRAAINLMFSLSSINSYLLNGAVPLHKLNYFNRPDGRRRANYFVSRFYTIGSKIKLIDFFFVSISTFYGFNHHSQAVDCCSFFFADVAYITLHFTSFARLYADVLVLRGTTQRSSIDQKVELYLNLQPRRELLALRFQVFASADYSRIIQSD